MCAIYISQIYIHYPKIWYGSFKTQNISWSKFKLNYVFIIIRLMIMQKIKNIIKIPVQIARRKALFLHLLSLFSCVFLSQADIRPYHCWVKL